MDSISEKEDQFFRKLKLAGDSVKPEWKDDRYNQIKKVTINEVLNITELIKLFQYTF